MDSRDPDEAPHPAGLCGRCRHVRIVTSDNSNVYYLCGLSAVDPRYAKYPALPLTDCAGFLRREPVADLD